MGIGRSWRLSGLGDDPYRNVQEDLTTAHRCRVSDDSPCGRLLGFRGTAGCRIGVYAMIHTMSSWGSGRLVLSPAVR